MSNYTPSGKPANASRGISAAIRNEFISIAAAINSKSDGLYGTDGGAANAYTVTPTNALSAYYAKLFVIFSPVASNTGASTLNISTLGAKSIKTVNGNDLSAGDLLSGKTYEAIYDGSQFYLIGGCDRSARAGDTYTGTHDYTAAVISVPTQAASDNSAKAASTEYVDRASSTLFTATSTTSETFGSGSKTLTIQTGKTISIGTNIIAAKTSDPLKYMRGIVTSYDSVTGVLVFTSDTGFTGSGSNNDWSLSLAGSPGTNGSSGLNYLRSNGTMTAGMTYYLDSSLASFTASMPPSPLSGDIVAVSDTFGTWATNAVTLGRNGSNFVDQYGAGQAEDFDLNVAGLSVTFIYTASGWKAI